MDHHKINYVEFPANDLSATKAFFIQAFAWKFEDYGPEYTAFSGQGIDGGFYQSTLSSSSVNGAALIVIYSRDLSASLETVQSCGGKISQAIFAFPGGRRFHFIEPSGNELAVWSDQ